MIFMLPAGIIDGILACTALILISTQYFGKDKIEEQDYEHMFWFNQRIILFGQNIYLKNLDIKEPKY